MNRRDAVRRAYDAVGDAYGDFRRADGPETDRFDDFLAALPPDARVLDAGSGDGQRTAAHLVDAADVVALDVSRRQTELVREHVPAATPVQGDMTRLPLADDTVDGVVAYYSVFHVPRADHPQVYREFARVLRPGGRLLCSVSDGAHEGTRSWLRGVEMFWSSPGRDATLGQLRDAGFEVEWERVVTDGRGESVRFVSCVLGP
jgi:ubiquinone/menaquinone biosynthesis C-methylase UbiE